MRLNILLLAFSLGLLSVRSSAQDYKSDPGYRFSKQDMKDYLLHESKSLKTKAIVAITLGPVLTGVGVYIMNKHPFDISVGSYVTARESSNAVYGKIICATGIITTITSIPLFISAGKAKRQAKLIVSDEPTSLLGKRTTVPSVGLCVPLP